MPRRLTYNRQQKLKSSKQIDALFSRGKSVSAFPLRLLYLHPETATDHLLKVGVAVSSRNFKKAVHRNRVKRLMREAYRLHQSGLKELLQRQNRQLTVMILFTDKALPTFELLNQKMQVLLNKLIRDISEPAAENT